jgi:hypothetical protein
VNADMDPVTGPRAKTDPQPQELADCLSLLEEIDRQVTPRHVAARLQELLADVRHDTTSDVLQSAGPRPRPRARETQPAPSGPRNRRPKPSRAEPSHAATALQPDRGLAALDERDLDAVLSGETAGTPAVLRPVADTLQALRNGPTRRELSGEAAIMAEFRAPSLSGAWRPADPAHSLELPVVLTDRSRRRAPRYRGRRTVPLVNRRAGTLMGVAAAVLIAVAVVFGHSLIGSIQYIAHLGPVTPAASSPHPGGSDSAPPGPLTTGTPSPAVHSTVPSASEPGELCRAYYIQLWSGASSATEVSRFQKLSKLAGGPSRIPGYCTPYLGYPVLLPGSPSPEVVPGRTGN